MKHPWIAPVVLSLSLGWLGCSDSSAPAPSVTEPDAAPAKTLRVAVIPKGTTHEFWKSIHAGARKAEQELNEKGTSIEVIWQGPLKESERENQIQIVENFGNGRVDGIVLAPLDSQALVRPVQAAAANNVPVVIIDSGLNTDKYVSFVATDNFKGGQIGGEFLAKLLGEKGKVILLRYAVGSASTEKREAGFLDAIQKFTNIEIISSDQYAGATMEEAYKTSENLLSRLGQEVDGIFCVNENSTIGMTKALREIGRAGGTVKLVGFDAGSQSLEDLANGDVQALVVQDPVRMGYQGVTTMIDHLQGKPTVNRIDTGVTMVTKENMTEPDIDALIHPPLEKYLKE